LNVKQSKRNLRLIRLLMNKTFLSGCLLLLIILLPCLLGIFFIKPAAIRVMADKPNLPPSLEHPLGTQSEGRDMLALMLVGTPATLRIGLIGGLVGLVFGILLGLSSGYFGGWLDGIIRGMVDVGLTIPSLAILIMIAASFRGLSVNLMGVVVALTAWMQTARTIRSQVLSVRERSFVQLAKLSGSSSLEVILQEILPNLIPYIAASFVDAVSTAILASIGLEVLGLGAQQAQTLGNTIYFAIFYSAMWKGMWWWWLPPIVVLVCIFLGLFLISMALDELANPRLHRLG
jgi:peptide/nickel transport system permease protein